MYAQRWFPALLATALTAGGCVQTAGFMRTPSPAPAASSAPVVAAAANLAIDPRIVGKYGMTGDVVWFLNPGHRPSIMILNSLLVEFESGTSDADVQAFLRRYGASLIEREAIPGLPGSNRPAELTDTYQLALAPATGDLADLAARATAAGFPSSPIFSSERAARIFYAFLEVRAGAATNHVKSAGFGSATCIPEACGVEPDDPYASPASQPTGASQTQAAGGISPPVPQGPQRLDVEFPVAKGKAYVLGNELFVEKPGQAPERLVAWEDRTSLLYLDPELKFVLLQERPQLQLMQVPTAVKTKPDGGSRLAIRTIPGGDRRVLIEHIEGYDIQLAVAPDAHTVAIRTTLAAGETRRMYLLDLDHPEAIHAWLGTMETYRFKWAPKGLTLAIEGAPLITAPTAMYLATPNSDTPKQLFKPDGAVSTFDWLPDGNRLAIGWSGDGKYGDTFHLSIADATAGTVKTHDLAAGNAHLEGGQLSPDGKQALVLSYGMDGSFTATTVDVETGTTKRYATAKGQMASWSAANQVVCGTTPCEPLP